MTELLPVAGHADCTDGQVTSAFMLDHVKSVTEFVLYNLCAM